jgi:preprotein translocase subunit SecF
MFFVSGSIIIEQIALTLLIGLAIDIPATWFTNAGVLRLWLEHRHGGHK